MDDPVELSPAQCRELLAADTVGRLAFSTPHGPRIVPVNYVVTDEVLEVRTSAYSELATYAPGEPVAFEIDHLDREHRRGWSVVVHGTCERVLDESAADFDEPHERPTPWAGGARHLLLRVPLSQVSGRRVGGEHWPHPAVPHAD